jgi:hypothetical protein
MLLFHFLRLLLDGLSDTMQFLDTKFITGFFPLSEHLLPKWCIYYFAKYVFAHLVNVKFRCVQKKVPSFVFILCHLNLGYNLTLFLSGPFYYYSPVYACGSEGSPSLTFPT